MSISSGPPGFLHRRLDHALRRLLDRLDVPRKDLGYVHGDGKPLLTRYALLKTANHGQVLLHRFLRADARDLGTHDHPWSFASIVILGWYEEVGPFGVRRRGLFSVGAHPAGYRHVQVDGAWPCWSLCMTGPRRPAGWGFPSAGISGVEPVSYVESVDAEKPR